MLEDALTSLWASMSSWFTPTVLFVVLNLVIGTIVVTSRGIRRVHAHPRDDDGGVLHHHFPRLDDYHHLHLPLLRSPSNVLERLKSIGSLYRYRSGNIPSETVAVAPPLAAASTSTSHRESEGEEKFETLDDAFEAAAAASSSEHHFARMQSDSHPTAGEMLVRLPAKLKKSASVKSAFAHFGEEEVEEVVVRRPPATTRPSHAADDEEVDARADDFINRFRQQLNLQRLDSIVRYKEMLTRGR